MEQGGQPLARAVVMILLTCVLTPHAAAVLEEDDTILEVTDGRNRALLGTEEKFKIFMKEHNKEYTTREEYQQRLAIFARNMVRAAEHQALDPTAVHGVTPFSDLSEEEFRRLYTGVVRVGPEVNWVGGGGGDGTVEGGDGEDEELPENFDWRENGAVTDVKMQVR